jgi:1-acyl-sn-glycerol-3-phosphate acyltransferase
VRLPIGKLAVDDATLLDRGVSAGLWAVNATWLATILGTIMVAQSFRRSDQLEWLNRLYCAGHMRLTGSRWRAFVDPSVDPNAVYMFCQNHVNHFDHCTMYNATPHFKQGLELESHFRIPFYGWFMKQRGTIPVRRSRDGGQSAEIMAYMREEVARGHSILSFPEGTRTRDGRVQPFRKGVFYIARDLGIPIVPVAVTGMQDVMDARTKRIRPGHTVTVYCDAPIETTGIDDDEVPALVQRVREPISRRVDAYLEATRGPEWLAAQRVGDVVTEAWTTRPVRRESTGGQPWAS